MKIGFDISQTGNGKAGCGFFTENLIRHLAALDQQNHYTLYQTFGDHFWDNDFKQTYAIEKPNFRYGLKHSSHEEAKKFWRDPPASLEKKLGHVDIVHANNFYCPPKLKQTKLIYTLFDLSFVEYPDCTTDHNRIACFESVFNASLNADYIIAISEFSRKHFLSIFPHYPADRIKAVPLASRFKATHVTASPSAKLKPLLPNQFWLSVGTLEPRKNIKHLLQCYAELKEQQKTYPLVLAGKPGWMKEKIEDTIASLNLQQDVVVLGYVEDEELQWLYQNCFGFIYPSLFEGFGLPVLEAMTFGAPIITSHTSSLPEVAGNAGILIDPLLKEDLISAMLQIFHDPALQQQLKRQSLQQAQLFSWENTAKQVLTIYENVGIKQ